MTFFLDQGPDFAKMKPEGPDLAPTGALEGLGAAFNKFALENDANFRISRERRAQKAAVAMRAVDILGQDAVDAEIARRGLYTDSISTRETVNGNPKAADAVLEMARKQAQANPETWKGVDLSDEGIDATINRTFQSEHADSEQILNMMPRWRGAVELAGGLAGGTLDIKNLPFLFLGGGSGSILSVMGREAGINMAAEGVFLPSQFEMAERLDIPDPSIVGQLATAAGAGAILGGAVAALPRALRYFSGRNQLSPQADPVVHEAATQAAEDALAAGDDPFAAVRQTMSELPPATPAGREPLILRDPLPRPPPEAPAALSTGELEATSPTPAGVPPVTTTTLADIAPVQQETLADVLTPEARIAETNNYYDAAIEDARSESSQAKKPLVSFFQSRVRKQSAAQGGGIYRDYRIDPDGLVGSELKNADITPKTHPGLFKKGGLKDIDTFVASEMEDTFPGISDAAGVVDGYLDRNGLLDVLIRDAGGDASWLRSRQRANELEAERSLAIREIEEGTPQADYLRMEPADNGFFVDLNHYQFADPHYWQEAIARDFDAFVAERGFPITPGERDEILAQLSKDGGDAEYLVERALERELDEAQRAVRTETSDADFPEEAFGPAPGSATVPGGQASVGSETPRGNAAEAGADPVGVSGASERTAAGQQTLIPGVAPITERQRLEARQSSPWGGPRTEPDSQIGGLFDPHDKTRTDLFSEPAGPKAKPAQDAMRADARDRVEVDGDFTADVGNGHVSASSLLDEMDADDEFQAVLDACGKPRGAE